MIGPRLALAADQGWLREPMLVIGARAGDELSALPRGTVHVQPFRPDHDALAAAGHDVRADLPPDRIPAALVVLPRAKPAARDAIARAAAVADGMLLIDGQKTDGIDSFARDLRKRGASVEVIAKSHGKLIALHPPDLSDWLAEPTVIAGGFSIPPGAFSSDGVDPGSALLAAALPEDLSGEVADLGAGWGYLSHRILIRPAVATCHMVEADRLSLTHATANVPDPRAVPHWADAATWQAPTALDHVVCNPPFHRGRAGDPEIGRAFLATAARVLAPNGQLWLVANRHLPYEAALGDLFAEREDLPGSAAFKLYRATKPRKATGGPRRRSR